MDVREKIVELLRNSPHLDTIKGYKGSDCTFEQGADWLIRNGVTVQEWISVDDMLPKQKRESDARNWYLVSLSNGVVKELAYEFHKNSVFGYGWRETTYPVTHWMPMPQPPKGE